MDCWYFLREGRTNGQIGAFLTPYTVELKKGKNHLSLVFEGWNNNMNVDVNKPMLHYKRVIPLKLKPPSFGKVSHFPNKKRN